MIASTHCALDQKFDIRLGINAAETPVKRDSDTVILTHNPAASRLPEIPFNE